MRVIYTLRASRDLDHIHAYIANRHRRAATAVSAAIRKLADGLAEFPLIGHPTDAESVLVLTLDRYPFRIFYRVVGDEVQILHIRHGARGPWQAPEP
jgi:addiction module RelE/StbE family toxin